MALNKTANDVLCDTVHRLYRGVVYLQNVKQFHGTCVNGILFRPIKIIRPPAR